MKILSETIDLYLDGQLEGQELVDFMKEVEEDKKLAQEINFHREIIESITDDEVHYLRQKLAILIPDLVKKAPHIKIFSAIAASIILVLSIFTITNQNNSQKVFDTYYAPYETDLNTRSAENTTTDISYAYLLYQNGEYKTAYSILENYNSLVNDNYTAVFYQGICALEIGDYKIAEEKLLSFTQEAYSPFTLHAKWYLAMLYLKTEDTEKASILLNELAKTDNFYSKRANDIIKSL
jgi:TolA-binding protein